MLGKLEDKMLEKVKCQEEQVLELARMKKQVLQVKKKPELAK